MSALPALFPLALLAIAYLAAKLYNAKQSTKRLQRSLDYYRETYLHVAGWDRWDGNYRFVSLDGGKNWFNAESTDDHGTIITGPADMDRLKAKMGMHALMDHVSKNGPLDLTSPSDFDLLGKAGFTVENKQK
jgi:hypothetical protein